MPTQLLRTGTTEQGNFTIERILPARAPSNPTFRAEMAREGPCCVNVSSRNICEIGSTLATGFLRHTNWSYWGVMTAEPSWLQERHFWKVDYKDPDGREHKMLDDLIRSCDVLHLNSWCSWEFLGRLREEMVGKTRVLMHHHGVALREDPPIAWQERDAGWEVVVSTPDLLMHVPWATWLPSPIDLEELDGNYPQWVKPENEFLVGHGYTVVENKDSLGIAKLVTEQMCKDDTIGFVPWHGVQKRQSLWLLSQCDIYFATLLYGPGVATYEAMAMGIPALCSCTEEELQYQMQALAVERPEDLPWIYVTRDTAGKWVRDLRNDPELRQHWAEKGRKYIEDVHSVPAVVARLKNIYDGIEPCTEVLYSGTV